MATEIVNSVQMFEQFIEQHPIDSKLLLRDVTWDEYERMLDYVSDPAGLRIAFDDGGHLESRATALTCHIIRPPAQLIH